MRRKAAEIAGKVALAMIMTMLYSWLLSSSVSRLLASIGEGR